MNITEFNNLKLASLDVVEIRFKDGSTRKTFLHQGHAYITEGEALHTAVILTVGAEENIERIHLFNVESVELIDRVEIK
ncbi:hypothetical protein DET49_1324 [Salegentibacter sp. 24]|uniref:hypothetical protein n=1 Tax=Salegentibacter sp. 24 TaxID=2183986 RepID=UPI00105D6B96|nr:hypothetical protein [Salegentibacter sp. 24]TDN80363.1 hypothetical protein DET49_1324 [Salegentibacter sp. 24]